MKQLLRGVAIMSVLISCNTDNDLIPENPGEEIFRIPLVIHVLHHGEQPGSGPNLSFERILRQIEILNDDFRRKEGTSGFNDHPDGADTKIEFELASFDPNGLVTSGILYTNIEGNEPVFEQPYTQFDYYGYHGFWDPNEYVNIWVAPYPEDFTNILLGEATGPKTDLPGNHLFAKSIPGNPEGIIVNWSHFGESDIESNYNRGRTLTHEMGHYLGLLHTWGGHDCESNDYCEDTPAVDKLVRSCSVYVGCDGHEVQVANYMNYTPDNCMNMFTKDQKERMRYVLKNSPRRKELTSSTGLALQAI